MSAIPYRFLVLIPHLPDAQSFSVLSCSAAISESTVTCTLNFPEFFSGAGIDDVSYSVVAESTSGQELERKQEQGHRLGQYLTATTSARKNETSVEITIASAPAGSVWTVVATARQCV